jgi:PST family polysaccharide transporter
LSHVAFGTSSYAWLFLVLGFSLSLYSLQFFLLAVINGEHDIPFFTLASVLGNLITITLTLGFVWKLHVTGAFLALILSPVISSLFTLAICSKRPWFNWRLLTQSIDPMAAKNLFRFAAMSMTSALVIPTSQLFVRWYISRSLSWHDAGLWQGMCRISDGYLMIITSTLAIYYLPKLSSITTPGELRQEILSGYRMILPTVSILALLVYLFRTPIITLLFSPSFLPMADLFGLQMIGDVLKIGSWLLAYLMLARSMTRVYIGTEIAFSVLYSLLVVIGVYFMGLQGSIIAFGLNYALYWVLIYFYTRIHWSVPK